MDGVKVEGWCACPAPMGLMLLGKLLLVLSSERDRTGTPVKHGQIFTRT